MKSLFQYLWKTIKVISMAGGALLVLVLAFLAILALLRTYEYHFGYDREDWLQMGKMLRSGRATGLDNAREGMVQDVMAHYLKPGMTRAQVLALLGPAERDGIERKLPDGVRIPDSLNAQNYQELNKWYAQHDQPDTIMRYQVGWSMIDPTSMRVEFRGDGRVKRYWVGLH